MPGSPVRAACHVGCVGRPVRALLDSLESRMLLSATPAALVRGTLSVRGTAAADAIDVHYAPGDASTLEVAINGVTAGTFPAAKVRVIRVAAGDGDDTVTITFADNPAKRCIVYGGKGNDTLTTGGGNDNVYGNAGDDVISTDGGRDWISGGDGNDTITGGDDADILYGKRGDDSLAGGGGVDRIYGGSGNDDIAGGTGRDSLHGGLGLNHFKGTSAYDRIFRRRNDVVDPALAGPTVAYGTTDELRSRLIETAMARYASLFGTTVTEYPWYWWGGPIAYAAALGSAAPATPTAPPPQVDHSGTNNQVAGVEEADLVKTDGSYVYILGHGAEGPELTIIDATDPDAPAVISHTPIAGNALGVFLDGDRVTVVSTDYGTWGPIMLLGGPGYRQSAPKAYVTIFDVTDHAAPVQIEQTVLDGAARDAREIDGQLYVTLQENITLPAPRKTAVGDPISPDAPAPWTRLAGGLDAMLVYPAWNNGTAQRYVYETESQYRAYLEGIIDTLLPAYTVDGGSPLALVAGDVYLPEGAAADVFTSVLNFDLLNDVKGPEAQATAYGFAGQVYASHSAMYMASNTWAADDNGIEGPSTALYKFDLAPRSVAFAASGTVPGNLLNSYSMDEHEGVFRIATTTWGISNWADSSNGLYVLEQSGDTLEVIGSVENLAPGERIQSVRFDGDEGYMVTFRRVDPLFTLDLADPAAPAVAGELKLPGYSSYLQMVDAAHLMGIGYSADADGRVTGLSLNLFDVSNLASPKLVDQLNIEGWASSEAQWDPHAVSYFAGAGAADGVLVIPISREGVNGFAAFSVDLSAGFAELGSIAHDSWGSHRSLQIAGRLYTVSPKSLKVSEMSDPSNVIASVALGGGGYWWGPIAIAL